MAPLWFARTASGPRVASELLLLAVGHGSCAHFDELSNATAGGHMGMHVMDAELWLTAPAMRDFWKQFAGGFAYSSCVYYGLQFAGSAAPFAVAAAGSFLRIVFTW